MGKLVLSIDDIAPDRDTVEIHGKSYELMQMDDFSLSKNAEVRRQGDKVLKAMQDLGAMTPEALQDFEETLNGLIGNIIREIPADIVAALPYKHRASLLVAFWQAVATQGKVGTAEKETEK